MSNRVLITGGAGFIGSHIADLLLKRGYKVRALDTLHPQVHFDGERPGYLADEVELIAGDVRDAGVVRAALCDVDAVIHLAAAVGVGQSMYEIAHYTSVNDFGTAVLVEALEEHPVRRVVVASSMSVYGEGLAERSDGTRLAPGHRAEQDLAQRDFEVKDASGARVEPVPTPESKPADPRSIYALNKYVQEQTILLGCRAKGISAAALRLFNVYGPNQALSNPYTGVLAIFAARILNGRAPLIFEDGLQRRDFVHVRDVARAFLAALERPEVAGVSINIGSGISRTILSVARELAVAMERPRIEPQITGKVRQGDIRHCFADTRLARQLLDFEATTDFRSGLAELAQYLAHEIAADKVAEASRELEARGLVT